MLSTALPLIPAGPGGLLRGAMPASVALLGVLWLVLINQLRLDWSTNAQYSYGWLVPFLALYLFWQRWGTRPPTAPAAHRRALAWTAVALACGFLPTRLIREAAPEWSLVSWAMALEVVGLTLVAIAWMGGPAAVRHFAWPVGFFLVAVAWPVRFETALTQSLMQHLAAITAEIVNLAGVSALREGNLIRLSTGVVGVDEACSGVRSLQSMLMAALFLGELNRLSGIGRALLVVGGLGLAVIFNIGRALLLVFVALSQGLPALTQWHDPAGYSILAVSFVILCLLARFLQKKRSTAERSSLSGSGWRPLPLAWIAGFGLWLGAAELTTELWYRAHEGGRNETFTWTVQWPEHRPHFQEEPINSNVRKILAYSEGRQASWEGAEGSRWLMFFFRWDAARTSTLAARLHRPEVCLPAGGQTLREERAAQSIPVGGRMVPFRSYLFDRNGQPLHVYFCLWEAGNRDVDSGVLQGYSRGSRLQRVISGQRNLGQQSLEVIISGMESAEQADAAFGRLMAESLVPGAD